MTVVDWRTIREMNFTSLAIRYGNRLLVVLVVAVFPYLIVLFKANMLAFAFLISIVCGILIYYISRQIFSAKKKIFETQLSTWYFLRSYEARRQAIQYQELVKAIEHLTIEIKYQVELNDLRQLQVEQKLLSNETLRREDVLKELKLISDELKQSKKSTSVSPAILEKIIYLMQTVIS